MILPSLLAPLSWNGTRVGPTAAVERAHSDRARSGSKGPARVSFHPFSSCAFREQEDDQAAHPSLQACSLLLQGWGLIDLPLRASNEGLLRPRVARAQKIIRLHSFLCSASKKGIWPLLPHSSEAHVPEQEDDQVAHPIPIRTMVASGARRATDIQDHTETRLSVV